MKATKKQIERMKRDQIDKLINPPKIIGPNTVVLCPPIGSVEDYMQYLRDHKEDYKRLFRGE